MGLVRRRIERTGERLWQFEDFDDILFSGVLQPLLCPTPEDLLGQAIHCVLLTRI